MCAGCNREVAPPFNLHNVVRCARGFVHFTPGRGLGRAAAAGEGRGGAGRVAPGRRHTPDTCVMKDTELEKL